MSYILDALRRADAERERGNVPSLHTQARPLPSMDDDERETSARRRLPAAAWIAGTVALAAIAMMLWRPWTDGAQQVTAAAKPGGLTTAPAQAAAPALPQAQPLPLPQPMPPAPVIQAPPVPPPAPLPKAVATPTPPRPTAARPASPTADEAPMPLRLDPRAASQSALPGARASSEPAARIPRLAELPDGVRRELPPLAFGGAMHSPDPFARMVIVNGQVWREGESVAPGLRLTRIRINSAVFEYKGQLFETAF